MKSYEWWKSQKRRVQKKYILLCGCYLSPKETKQFLKWLSGIKRKREEE